MTAVVLQELLAQVSLLKPLLYLHEVCPCPWINRGRALTLDAFVYACCFRQTSQDSFRHSNDMLVQELRWGHSAGCCLFSYVGLHLHSLLLVMIRRVSMAVFNFDVFSVFNTEDGDFYDAGWISFISSKSQKREFQMASGYRDGAIILFLLNFLLQQCSSL